MAEIDQLVAAQAQMRIKQRFPGRLSVPLTGDELVKLADHWAFLAKPCCRSGRHPGPDHAFLFDHMHDALFGGGLRTDGLDRKFCRGLRSAVAEWNEMAELVFEDVAPNSDAIDDGADAEARQGDMAGKPVITDFGGDDRPVRRLIAKRFRDEMERRCPELSKMIGGRP